MKRITTILAASLILSMQACNSGNGKDSVAAADSTNSVKDTSGMSATSKDTMSVAPVNGDAAKFAVEAANGGMAEVKLGALAASQGMDKEVKDFGAMMVKDHTKANDELKALAAKKNITLPATLSDDMQKKMDDLKSKTGKDFDKAYVDMMVSDHKDDIDAFEKEAKSSDDVSFKDFATKTLPTLNKHLQAIKAIQDSKHY